MTAEEYEAAVHKIDSSQALSSAFEKAKTQRVVILEIGSYDGTAADMKPRGPPGAP